MYTEIKMSYVQWIITILITRQVSKYLLLVFFVLSYFHSSLVDFFFAQLKSNLTRQFNMLVGGGAAAVAVTFYSLINEFATCTSYVNNSF